MGWRTTLVGWALMVLAVGAMWAASATQSPGFFSALVTFGGARWIAYVAGGLGLTTLVVTAFVTRGLRAFSVRWLRVFQVACALAGVSALGLAAAAVIGVAIVALCAALIAALIGAALNA